MTDSLIYEEDKPRQEAEKTQYQRFMEFIAENSIETSEDFATDTILIRIPRRLLDNQQSKADVLAGQSGKLNKETK